MANLTSSLGYDASSLGNHEFDDGVDDIEAFSDAIKGSYPMLACNLDMSRVPELQKIIKPYILKEFRGETIAIVGYVTPDTKELSDTGNVEFIDEMTLFKLLLHLSVVKHDLLQTRLIYPGFLPL